jgi:hypothetical protein
MVTIGNLEIVFILWYYFQVKFKIKSIDFKYWIKVLLIILYIAYCIDGGFFLVIAPWFQFWQQNVFRYHFPPIKYVFDNFYVRGAISGIGLLLMGIGIGELRNIFRQIK